MPSNKTPVKPSIMIYAFPHEGYERKIRETQAGMEEEGVPCSLATFEQADAVCLAYKGAGDSQLGVGVGIGPAGMCIHYSKLPADQPVFVLEDTGTDQEWRRFGYNAARLIKGIPFKERDTENIASYVKSPELCECVREIVIKILQETVQGHGEVKTWSKTP